MKSIDDITQISYQNNCLFILLWDFILQQMNG